MTEGYDPDMGSAMTAPSPVCEAPASFEHDATISLDHVIAALRTVYDPEIPVNIYDLGLIYRVEQHDPDSVEIDMTLTAPGCPVAGEMLHSVRSAVTDIACVDRVTVNLIFDPPWDMSRMSEEAKFELGFF